MMSFFFKRRFKGYLLSSGSIPHRERRECWGALIISMTLCKTNTLFHLLLTLYSSLFSFFPLTVCVPVVSRLYCSHLSPPIYVFHGPSFDHLTCCFLLVMGGSMGLEEQQVLVVFIHWDPRLPWKLGAVESGTPKRQTLPLGASLVGAWYLTCFSSSSVSWGTGLNGELKTPGH